MGKGYKDWLSFDEFDLLVKCFQQRHLLQHKEGIVDQDYINKSKDDKYTVGQWLIIKAVSINEYSTIVEKLGKAIIEVTFNSK